LGARTPADEVNPKSKNHASGYNVEKRWSKSGNQEVLGKIQEKEEETES